ncbi:MAG: hypothetical protein RR330_01870 [Alistipes sp.]
MTGIRKRVTIGFLSIVCLLFFSGMISYFELRYLSRDTDEILKANRRNIELAKDLLRAAHEQNIASIQLAFFGDHSYDSICLTSMHQLEQTLAIAQEESVDKSSLDSLAQTTAELRFLINGFLTQNLTTIPDSLHVDSLLYAQQSLKLKNENWYHNQYDSLYRQLTSSIQSYMTYSQSSLAPRAEQVKKNASRAVTPVLISLLVMIAIVLMLFYFMTIYCVNPIVGINKRLGDYLSFHIPFKSIPGSRDEIAALQEKIETLITISKQPKA